MVRHPSTKAKMGFFSYDHLPKGPLRSTSKACSDLAHLMFDDANLDGEQLTLGLQRLLEAKDCFVRSAIKEDSNDNNS